MKNNILIWSVFIFTLLSIQGCSDLLRENPNSVYGDGETMFANNLGAELAVRGIYETLARCQNYGQGDFCIGAGDDMMFMTNGAADNGLRDLAFFRANSGNKDLLNLWISKYEGLNRANMCIDGFKRMESFIQGDPVSVNLEGEARFLRALCSFDLVRTWGSVPYKTEPTVGYDQCFVPRISANEIYKQIIDDLEIAINHLNWAKGGNNPERATQGAARALLMRVLMQRAGYALDSFTAEITRPDEATRENYFKEVIRQYEAFQDPEQGADFHQLVSEVEPYWKSFCQNIFQPTESLFEIGFYTLDGNVSGASRYAAWVGPLVHMNSKYGRCNAFIRVLNEWVDFYADGDTRRDINMSNITVNADNSFTVPAIRDKTYYVGKWRRYWISDAPKDPNNTDVNPVILRYADVLMLAAEAYSELGQTSKAVEIINRIRNRAFGDKAHEELASDLSNLETVYIPRAAATAPNKESMFGFADAVLPECRLSGDPREKFRVVLFWERAYEFAGEKTRKYDLIRWDCLTTSIDYWRSKGKTQSQWGGFYQRGKSELYPIPISEMQANPLITSNNPGY